MRQDCLRATVLEALEPRLLFSTGEWMPGDANLDGVVDSQDFVILKGHFGKEGEWSEGNFNGDGVVDASDFTILKAHYGQENDPPAPAPDPDGYQPGTEVTWRTESLDAGLGLVVLGTDGSDAITVSRSGGATIITVAGQTHTLLDDFARVDLYGFGGDDLLVSISGTAETIWGGAGFDSFWADSLDAVSDVDSTETAGASLHIVTEFYQPTDDPAEYVSLELAGQDIVDPLADKPYADFSDRPVFADGAEYDDVIQGNLGDCYFLAALSSLADSDPTVIEQMVAPLGDGTYGVRFHRNGSEVYLRIDGELPAYYGIIPANARLTPDGELWVALAEKAYAQFRTGQNSYASVAYGWMDAVYPEITGADAGRSYISQMSEGELVSFIAEALTSGRAVSAGTQPSAARPMVRSHAYVVRAVENVGGDWYVTVYNVWGQDGNIWDSNYDDGLLAISLEMFQQNFSAICVSPV